MRKSKAKTDKESSDLITKSSQVKRSTILNFGEITRSRLAEYKKMYFPDFPDGISKRYQQPYPHILPEKSWSYNFLPTYKDQLINYIRDKRIKRHSDFHHLNSSQAMCLNFFFPLFSERKLELITDFLGLTNETVEYKTASFEKDGLEKDLGSKRPTKFDFFFETKSAKRLYFEIKYTEGDFGADSETDFNKRNFKFGKFYSNALEPLRDEVQSSQSFSENYQILRNLVHINQNSYVIFIYPDSNHRIRKGVTKATDFLIPEYHGHFLARTWEQLFEYVSASIISTSLGKQLIDFKNKYLPLTAMRS